VILPESDIVVSTTNQAMEQKTTVRKKTIMIYSPDMNFCFSLSTFFQNRYNVVTTTDPAFLSTLVSVQPTDLVIIDDEPSGRMIERLQEMRRSPRYLPVMMLYVYGPRGGELDKAVRHHVDAVFYKPFSVHEMTKRIEDLIGV
jgi:DNA-binding response OmpR family regulator